MKTIRCFLCCLCCALTVFSVSSCSGTSKNTNIKIAMGPIPATLDPQMVSSEEELLVTRNCFEGLFRATGGQIQKGCCDHYTVSSDGLVYTFNIKHNLKWSDGTAVKADDFAFGLIRSLLPETLTPNSDLLFTIKNAKRFYNGKADRKDLGIQALSDYTLRITLDQKDAELIQKLSYSFAMPCKEDFFLETKGRYCMDRKSSLFNGPFAISNWDAEEETITLSSNAKYIGNYSAYAAYITFTYGTDPANRMNNINQSVYDVAFLAVNSGGNADNADLNLSSVKNKSWAVFFNPKLNNAISDTKVSQSLKTALASADYEHALPYGFVSTKNMIPDDIVIEQKAYSEFAFNKNGYPSDLEKGKKELIAALENYNRKFPEAALLYINSDDMKALATAIVSHWQTTLGAYINIKAVTENEMKTLMANGEYQMALCPIYDTDCSAVTFVEQFASENENNIYGIADKTLDSYVNNINFGSPSESIRAIESRLISNSRIIPIAQSSVAYAASKKISGLNTDMYQGHIDLFKLNK